MLPVTARVFRHAFVRGSVVPRVRMAPAWATQVACNSTARGVPPQHAAGGTGAGKPPAGQPQRPMGIVDANGNILRSKPAAPASKPGIPSAPATKEVIIEVDASNFQAVVLQSPVAVILDCYADWCEPCKQLTPKLEAIVRSAKGLVRLAKLNVDTSPGISAQLGVRSLPSVLGIVAGRMVDSFTGLIPDEGLKQFFTKVITAAEQAGMTHPDGNPLDKVVAGITECSTMVDEGAFSEATTKISSLIETLQQYYTQVYEGLRAEADRAATQASQTPLPVRTDTGPLADLDNLTARAISVLSTCHLPPLSCASIDPMGTCWHDAPVQFVLCLPLHKRRCPQRLHQLNQLSHHLNSLLKRGSLLRTFAHGTRRF